MTSYDIPKITLDPQNEADMLVQMYQRIRAASGNTLTDFSSGSPIAALGEGQVYAIAELLYYLNMLPEASALEVLRLSGVSRNAGTYATGSLSVLLKSRLGSAFELPQGFILRSAKGNWVLTEALYIPAGTLEKAVKVRSAATGKAYNASAFSVSITDSGLSYVQTIYNPEPLTGGSDLEPLTETVARAQVALRSRAALVSATDYELKAQELLGSGAKAWCLPLLSSDRETEKPGHVHVFCLDSLRVPPSTATCQSIQQQLRDLSFAGSSTWVSPASIQPLNVDVVISTAQLSDALAADMQAAIVTYLDPKSYPLGGTLKVKELEYLVRSIKGVSEVVSLLIDRQAVNRAMPLKYSHPQLDVLTVSMTTPDGYAKTYYLGTGTGDTD